MKICPRCGAEMQAGARFCGNCRNMFTQSDAAHQTTTNPAGNPNPGLGMRFKIGIGALLAILLVSGGFFGLRDFGTEAQVQQKLELAVKYLNENNYEQAILAYNAAIKIDPRNVEARVGLAQAYIGIGDFEKAEEAVTTAMDIGSLTPEQFKELIAAYIKQGKYQEAELLLAQAKERYSTNEVIADVELLLKAKTEEIKEPPPAQPQESPEEEPAPLPVVKPAPKPTPVYHPQPSADEPDSGSVSNIY